MSRQLKLGASVGCAVLLGMGPSVFANVSGNSSYNSDENAQSGNNTYQAIVARNVFHLAAAAPAPAATHPPESTVKLTGLVQMSGQRPRALFVSVAKDRKEKLYYNLCEGQRDGALEVVKILEDKEGAEVIHAGNRMTVWLKDSKPITSLAVSEPATSPIPSSLTNSLSESQLSELEAAFPSLSEGQREALLAEAQVGGPTRMIREFPSQKMPPKRIAQLSQ